MTTASHISIGQLGERIAERYLNRKGFQTMERNFRRSWGEIDLVMKKDEIVHFVEVKSASCSHFPTSTGADAYRPEDHMHTHKRERMRRIIETYCAKHGFGEQVRRTADLVVVYINPATRQARVHVLYDVLLTET